MGHSRWINIFKKVTLGLQYNNIFQWSINFNGHFNLGYNACECRASNYTCIKPYELYNFQICDGHGTCECGKCKCDKVMWGETVEGQYYGRFCENYLRSDTTVCCVENCQNWDSP